MFIEKLYDFDKDDPDAENEIEKIFNNQETEVEE